MKKHIKLPAPELSELKEVDVDLDMTGRHYALLATSENEVPETVICSILKDLVEQDANKLTMSEARYIFMLIKINSLENNFTATVKCTRTIKEKTCNYVNKFNIKLSDADLNPTPKHYQPPVVTIRTKDIDKECTVIPPSICDEIALYDYFIQQGYSVEQLEKDKSIALKYNWIRSVMHLVDKNGNRLIKNSNDFDEALSWLELNKYQTITHLYEDVSEVDGFGVQSKNYTFKCKECGGTLTFHLPLLYGLTS